MHDAAKHLQLAGVELYTRHRACAQSFSCHQMKHQTASLDTLAARHSGAVQQTGHALELTLLSSKQAYSGMPGHLPTTRHCGAAHQAGHELERRVVRCVRQVKAADILVHQVLQFQGGMTWWGSQRCAEVDMKR